MAIEHLAKEKQQHLDLKKTDNVGRKASDIGIFGFNSSEKLE